MYERHIIEVVTINTCEMQAMPDMSSFKQIFASLMSNL